MPRQRHGSAASSMYNADRDAPNHSHSGGDGGGQEMASMYDYLAKVILLGPSGSGKSCLLHRFVKHEWRVLSSQTIGVEFASKIVKIGTPAGRRRRIKLQLWDTAGTERFRSVSRSYYRGAAAAILVYDIANPQSLTDLHTFLLDARALASPHLTVILVGNKSDLADPYAPPPPSTSSTLDLTTPDPLDPSTNSLHSTRSIPTFPRTTSQQRATVAALGRAVPSSTATAWARANNISATMEVSALTGAGVDALFTKLAATILTKLELAEIDPDDPLSGIQYGDADYYHYDDGDDASSSLRSSFVPGGGLTSDGYAPGSGSMRRRKRRGAWSDVLRLRAPTTGTAGEGRCC